MSLTQAEKDEWTRLLRSGEYTQTTGVLHNKEGFCCLGVAADFLLVKQGKAHWEKNLDRYLLILDENLSEYAEAGGVWDATLPESVGISTQATWADRNDIGETFKIIANGIDEMELEEL